MFKLFCLLVLAALGMISSLKSAGEFAALGVLWSRHGDQFIAAAMIFIAWLLCTVALCRFGLNLAKRGIFSRFPRTTVAAAALLPLLGTIYAANITHAIVG